MAQLRWGVLGAAGIARMAVVPAIQSSCNGHVVAVASRDAERKREWAADLAIEKVVGSYEALLADPEIDAVYIPLPNSLHLRWIEAAAQAGKAVLCEKPLGIDADEARCAVAACEAAGVPLMEGFMHRFHPQHERVWSLIQQGVIGEVREVQAHLSVNLMTPPDPQNVRFKRGLGGGALLDMGCYTVNIARMIFAAEPVGVQAAWRMDPNFGVDTDVAATLDFGDGRTALVSCSFRGNGQGFYRVIGARGVIDVPRGIILGLDGRVGEAIITCIDEKGGRHDEVIVPVDQYRLMVEEFSHAVLAGDPAPYPAGDSIGNMAVLDAIAASARAGRAAVGIGR